MTAYGYVLLVALVFLARAMDSKMAMAFSVFWMILGFILYLTKTGASL